MLDTWIANLELRHLDAAELDKVGDVLRKLALWAAHQARAMRLLEDGDVDAAFASQKASEATYRTLPEWARF